MYFQQAKAEIGAKGSTRYTDPDEYREIRCACVDKLFDSIQAKGYQSKFESEHTAPKVDERSKTWFWSRLEPLVTIGRDGEIFLNDGRHRFAIATILGIESIPVHVVGRHRDWQRVRDGFAHADDVTELRSDYQQYAGHPDLRDVVCS